jgi:SAM-dependent methyltransferase
MAFRLLGNVPYGNDLYYLLQRYVTRTLPRHKSGRGANLDAALSISASCGGNKTDPNSIRVLEIGAGWDLYQSIILYMFGVNHQKLVDVRRWAKPGLVNETIEWLRSNPPADAIRLPASKIDPSRMDEDLKRRFGIEYLAPTDGKRMPVADHSIDFVVTTSVFEHVPAPTIPEILAEFRRVLKPSGVMSHIIDFSDHYAHSDPRINNFNYCQFPKASGPSSTLTYITRTG